MTPCAAGILASLSACGGDDAGPRVRVPLRDSGVELDARSDSAASFDAQSGDGAAGADANLPSEDDAGPAEPFNPVEDCKIIEERSELSLPVSFGDESGFTITPGLTGFGVAYQSGNCGAIGVLPVAAVGKYAAPKNLFTSCDTVAQGVSLLYHGSGYRLAWIDNSTGSAELQSLQLAEALDLPANPARSPLTNNLTRELAPVQANIAGVAYLGWINQDGDKREVMLRGAATSEPRTLVAADAAFTPLRLALAQLGDDSAALAFVSEEKQKGVWLVPLTAAGEARGEPVQLTASVTTGNSVDVATREEDGGAVIYSLDVGARHEVRFRRLNKNGELISGEVKVVTFPLQGRDASISRLGGGYVVAFRSVSADDPRRGEVRIMFVTKEGNLQRDSAGNVASYVVAEASSTGGRVTARVSRDGQLLVGFLDTAVANDQGPQFRLIRRRFDCAL
jgi:hypothetical protein